MHAFERERLASLDRFLPLTPPNDPVMLGIAQHAAGACDAKNGSVVFL